MSTLYQLKDEILAAKAELEQMEDLDQETINDTLEALQMPIEEKAENIIKLTKEWEAMAEAKKAEAKRLKESADQDLKKVKRLKEYLHFNLQQLDIKKLQAGVFSISFRKGSEVVEVNESELPKEYFIPQDPKPMGKAELKKLLKEGAEIPGAVLVRKPEILQVK